MRQRRGTTARVRGRMAALAMAVARCRRVLRGTEVPIPELASVVRDLGTRIVGVSVSSATRGPRTVTGLAKLRRLVASRVTMIVGGDGAPRALAGATIVRSLSELVARIAKPRA